MSRRASRVAAVEVLYGADVRGASPSELLCERDDVDAYALHIVDEVTRRRDELDEIIERHAVGWRPDRMSPVDLNVIRIAVLEMLEEDVPVAAAIDEAVEIAKLFSGEEAGRFVNGVLSGVLAAVQTGGPGSGDKGSVAPGEIPGSPDGNGSRLDRR